MAHIQSYVPATLRPHFKTRVMISNPSVRDHFKSMDVSYVYSVQVSTALEQPIFTPI